MCNTITSVLGFDLDADITDNEGNVIPSGTKCNYIPENKPDYVFNIDYYNKWTLLDKIRDYQKYNL